MAAYSAGNWQVINRIGVGDLSAVGATALYPLGTRVRAVDQSTNEYGYGDFIYLLGVADVARGSVCLIKDDYSTSLCAARDKGALGVALGAAIASTYGWFQTRGKAVVLTAASTAANVPLYLCATAATLDDDATAGDCVVGARTVNATDTGTSVVNFACHAATADFDNA